MISGIINRKDYLEMLLSLTNGSIDLICIDPPYMIDYLCLDWDKPDTIDFGLLLSECSRVLSENGNLILFTGWSTLPLIYATLEKTDTGLEQMNSIVWDRQKTKNGGKKNFTSAREDILWFVKNESYTFNKEDSTIKKKTKGYGSKNGSEYRRLSNVWTDIAPLHYKSKEYTGYSCQKPLALMRRIIRIFSNPGDIVLDCFCGSGSTLEASKLENRRFLGSDNRTDAVDLAKRRVGL